MNNDQYSEEETDEKTNNSEALELETLQTVSAALAKLQPNARCRLLNSVATFFNVNIQTSNISSVQHAASGQVLSSMINEAKSQPLFSEDRTISPKEFLLEKQPTNDIERVTCLAYYLTHYRDISHFKTLEISKLNTEAAQRKFSNPSKSVANANRGGYLVPATKGNKQISAQGEQFVQALPDRAAAKNAMARIKPRRKNKTVSKKATKGK